MAKLAVIVDGGFIRSALYIRQNPDYPDRSHGCPDANTIYQKIKTIISKKFPKEELFRIFYYDCIPDIHEKRTYPNPMTGKRIKLLSDIQTETQRTVFDQLKEKPYIAFRYGELSFDGWKIRNISKFKDKLGKNENISDNDFKIKVTQKGVDLKMGLDIAWLAMNNIVDKVLIIAGDSDLIPAMKFARKEGLMVYLHTLGKGVKKSMFEHSDLAFKTKN